MKTIGIVVPVLNYFKGFTDLALSIKTKHNYKIYVQPQYRAQVPLSAAWNKGSLQAFAEGCDYALVCNDDIMFAPECIDGMVEQYELLKKQGIIMVTPNNILGEIGDAFNILNYKLPEGQEPSFSDHPNFSCFLIAPEYFEKVGMFDENFAPAWYEDNDSHRRATLAGLREICTTAAPMVHIGGVTTHMMENNVGSGGSQAYYIEKWGGIPESHPLQAQKEHYLTPYNDPNLTIKDWRGNQYV
jgi:hypothetical protein